MVYIFGLAAVVAALLGGMFALKKQDKLHLILGFSAGSVVGVAFFDLLPEALELTDGSYDVRAVTTVVAVGFLTFMLLSRFILLHPHSADGDSGSHDQVGQFGAASLALHSFFDGLGIGLAFQVSNSVGLVVGAAVLAHRFSDGINTVSFILQHHGGSKRALQWLSIAAIAPMIGILTSRFIILTDTQLGLVLSIFAGFFLYLGASDLIPESQHRHPKMVTSLMTILGVIVIYGAVLLAGE